jgi:predicted dehydrogenase
MPVNSVLRARPCEARVALIGAGSIGSRYVGSLQKTPGFNVISVCSRNTVNADRFATEHGLSATSMDGILADPNVNYVLNLTPADQHAMITSACLQAGKSVYSEKPLAHSISEADALIALADHHGLLLACAPATFLWPPMATARKLVREGRLGSLTGALSTLVYQGPEIFHPNPSHLYGPSAGPLRDMGVYQITALMALLGPVANVSAVSSRSRMQRDILVGPNVGKSFRVDADTHFQAQLLHSNGAVSSMIVSFDGISASSPQFDVFGTKAGLSIENPHSPDGKVILKNQSRHEEVIAAEPEWAESSWGIGPVSAWNAYYSGQIVETNAKRARDVLAVLIAVENAAASNAVISVKPSLVWS